MIEKILIALVGVIGTVLSAIITNYFTKKKYLNDFRMRDYEHKKDVYENLSIAITESILLVYETKPFGLLEIIQQASTLANKSNQQLLQEFYNFVDTAFGQDAISEIKNRFFNIQPQLSEELANDFRKIR
ncbi:MAG: hypothetical protein IJD77_00805 [Clostridia bacterium]|nr:hypothetical protein [Clostridia bacterium]